MDEENTVYTYNRISFSLKKAEILPWATTWADLEDVMLREISHVQKD